MAEVGNRLLSLRTMRGIERKDAAQKLGISENELKEIELFKADYDMSLLLKCCDLYKTTVAAILDENEKGYSLRTPKEEDYNKFEDTILCTDVLLNPLKKNTTRIKKPARCTGPSSDYYAWRILSSEYCLNGYIILKQVDSLQEGDIIVAIVKQKPVYGFFRVIEGDKYINPVNSPKNKFKLSAKGVKVVGLVKYLDINVG